MDAIVRDAFNHHDPHATFERYRDALYAKLGGPFPFRLAETPLFLTPALRDHLQECSDPKSRGSSREKTR